VCDLRVDAVDAPGERLRERLHRPVLLDVPDVRVVPEAAHGALARADGERVEVELAEDVRRRVACGLAAASVAVPHVDLDDVVGGRGGESGDGQAAEGGAGRLQYVTSRNAITSHDVW